MAGVPPSSDPPVHRFLGHPDPMKGEMQLECQLAANCLLGLGALDWCLLLQVDSQDEARMVQGDAGLRPACRCGSRFVSRSQDSDSGHGDVLVSGHQSHIAWVAGHDGDLVVRRRLDDGAYV